MQLQKLNPKNMAFSAVVLVMWGLLILIAGAFSSAFVDIAGNKYALLLAVPAAILLGILFVVDKYLLLLLILIFRSGLDAILDNTKLGPFGLGAVLNALVLIIGLFAMYRMEKSQRKLVVVVWLPFLIMYGIGVVKAPEIFLSVKLYLSLISTAAVFALGIYLVKTHQDFYKWMKVIVMSSLIPVGYGLLSIALHLKGFNGNRLESTFDHPNILAFYLTLIISVGFYLWKADAQVFGPRVKKLFPFYLIVLIGMLLATQTRSAWIGFGTGLVLYGLFFERKYLFVVITLPIIAFMIPEVRDRILDLNSGNEVVAYAKLNSFAWRKYIWESAINWMEPAKYLTGYGSEGFMYYSVIFFPLSGGFKTGAHNVYVELFFDLGIFGVLAYITLFAASAVKIFPLRKAKLLLSGIAILQLLQYCLYSYSDNMLFYLSFNWYFWFFIGLVVGLNTLIKKERDSESLQPTPQF